MGTLGAIVLAALVAQDQQQPRQDRGQEFRVNMLKQRLNLTDEQTTKVREIYQKDADEQQKLEDARVAKVKEVLTDEQKTQYDEVLRSFRGGQGGRGAFQFGGQGGQPGGGRGGFQFGGGGLGGFRMEDLKRELSLTDEQVGKIQPIIDEFAANATKRMEELRQGGFQGLNWQEEMQKFQDSIKGLSDKVKAHLDEEQKKKLDARMEQATGWMRAIPNFLGGQRGTATGAVRLSVDERVRRAMEALKIEKDIERQAVQELVTKVVKAQDAAEDYQKGSREGLQTTGRNSELSDQAIEDKLAEQRTERRRLEKALAELQGQLADVVTTRQEIELILLGILK
jgi:Spy/CpxP family protein refolding chaperone